MSLYVVNRLPVGTHVDPGLWRESLSFWACVHRESPVGSVLVEPQDIERAVGAFDLAIAVIGAEPLIEDLMGRGRLWIGCVGTFPLRFR